MSNKAMTFVWENSPQRGSALLVLLAIADMANDDMVCYPGKGHLAKKCRMGVRGLTAILRKLEEAGEIQIYHRRTGNKNSSNVYRVMNQRASIGNRLMNHDSLPDESRFITPDESRFTTLMNHDSPRTLIKPKDETGENRKPQTPFDRLIEKDNDL